MTDITELAQREKFEAWAEERCALPWGYLKTDALIQATSLNMITPAYGPLGKRLAIYREGAYDENANQSDTELLLRLNRHGENGVVYCEQRHGAIYDCDQEAASQRRREKEEKPTKRGGF